MRKAVSSILLVVVAVGAYFVGSWRSGRTGSSFATAAKPLYYVDPMHPAYKSNKPGIAPDCGMDLVPVYERQASATVPDEVSAGIVSISPEKQQLMGVRVSAVEKISGPGTLRLFGRVVPDETRTYKLNAGIDGYIQQVSSATTGSRVKKDQLLATFSAPNATMIIQTFILNSSGADRIKRVGEGSSEVQSSAAAAANVQQRVQQLQNLGMPLLQVEEIKRTREIPESIKIVAPADGFILSRNVSPGLKFDRGAEWYQIADLAKVWVLADVFENDAQYLRPGARATVAVRGQRESVTARVSDILPQVDPATRKLTLRLEVDNPGYLLRPNMFADVELPLDLPHGIAVPTDAVLDTGLAKTVFVDRGEGHFEPRTVKTGWQFGDKVEIVGGLHDGEHIVISGTFLVDSESKLKTVAAREQQRQASPQPAQEHGKDPACGMDVDPSRAATAGLTSRYHGTTFYFCSESCKRKFDLLPEHYLADVPASQAERVKPENVKVARTSSARRLR